MKTPLVSVIIPTYNRSDYLDKAIESVVNQTYKNLEILVVDDGSSENYAEQICSKFDNCFYHYKINGGVSSARNYGINEAKGDLIAFLDDDDLWQENKLEKQIKVFQKNSNVSLVHSPVLVIDEKGNLTGKSLGASKEKAHLRSGYVFWNALGSWLVKAPTPLIKREVFNDVLMFDEQLFAGEDADFYQRLFYLHQVSYLHEPLAFYRVYNSQKRLSTQKDKYLGVEKRTFQNLRKMGIKNPFTLNRIARKLLKTAVDRKSKFGTDSNIKLTIFDYYLRPIKKLRNL